MLDLGGSIYACGDGESIFAFGAAEFAGSVPQVVAGPLNSPVNGLVADHDRRGYWLVAGDGGVFAFDAPFVGVAARCAAARDSASFAGQRHGAIR